MKITDMKSQGNKLPGVGWSFDLAHLTGRLERDIVRLIESEPSLASTLTWQVLGVLAGLVTKIGPHDFADVPLKDRANILEKMSLNIGDAYFLYLQARIKALGPVLTTRVTCSICKTRGDYPLQLSDFAVHAAESPAELTAEVELVFPVTLAGVEYRKAVIRPAPFLPRAGQSDDFIGAKSKLVSLSATLVGYEFPLSEEAVLEWDRRVISQLAEAVDAVTPGVADETAFECGTCKNKTPMRVDWAFTSFFA